MTTLGIAQAPRRESAATVPGAAARTTIVQIGKPHDRPARRIHTAVRSCFKYSSHSVESSSSLSRRTSEATADDGCDRAPCRLKRAPTGTAGKYFAEKPALTIATLRFIASRINSSTNGFWLEKKARPVP